MPISLGRWTLDPQPALTRDAFAPIEQGAADICPCDLCCNFVAARDRAYPDEFRTFLNKLGIPQDREAETCYMHRLDNELHAYCGWFHCLGQVLEGTDAFVSRDESSGSYDLFRMTDVFEFGITMRAALVPDSFPGGGVLQIEFVTQIPWVIDVEPPE